MNINRIEWTKKGLGWVPDLPNVTKVRQDENLKSLGGEEANSVLKLTLELISLIEILEKNLKYSGLESTRQNLLSLKEKVSPDYSTVLLLPILYKDQPRDDSFSKGVIWIRKKLLLFYFKVLGNHIDIENNKVSEEYFFKSIPKEVKCSETLNYYQELEKSYRKIEDKNIYKAAQSFNKSQENNSQENQISGLSEIAFSWLYNDEFDIVLEFVIKYFQYVNCLLADGIVGPKTYQRILDNDKSDENSKEIDYLFTPSLTPDRVLDICFDYLRIAWLQSFFIQNKRIWEKNGTGLTDKQILIIKEYFQKNARSFISDLNKFISSDPFNLKKALNKDSLKLTKVKIKLAIYKEGNKFREYCIKNGVYQYFKKNSGSKVTIVDIRSTLIESLKLNNKDDEISFCFFISSCEIFREVFRRNFSYIEPLVSALYQSTSPFAEYLNSKQAVDAGFCKLYSYFDIDFTEKNESYEPLARLFQLYSGQDILENFDTTIRERYLVRELGETTLAKINRKLCENNTNQKGLSEIKKIEELIDLSFLEFIKYICSSLKGLSSVERKGSNESAENDDNTLQCDQGLGADSLKSELNKLYSSFTYGKQEVFAIYGISADKLVENTFEGEQVKDCPPFVLLKFPYKIQGKKTSLSSDASKAYYFLLPSTIDLSFKCPPVRDQGYLNSCAALCGTTLVEYWYHENFNRQEDLSALFLYKTSREVMQRFGDAGASMSATIQAITLFGLPPEDRWPYNEANFDDEPPAFCYSYAQNYQTLQWFRLDSEEVVSDRQLLLFKIRATLAAGIPCMFGLTLFSSVYNEWNITRGYIPYPNQDDGNKDQLVGGHNLVAVGYNDHKIVEQADGNPSAPGALLVRNSWGLDWGRRGYGWLPYDYILKGLTADWWALIKAEQFDLQALGSGVRKPGGDPPPQPASIIK